MLFTWWYKSPWISGAPTLLVFFFANVLLLFGFESARLYQGYAGNLQERVPQLFLYVLFTFLSAMILVALIFLPWALSYEFPPNVCHKERCILAIEYACWYVQLVLHGVGFCEGYVALKRSDALQIQRFNLVDFEEIKLKNA
eukprot:GEMP01057525.1.p2 GENE.GEMP01057525.1~~GEMP01057525.1.p2  ORF type:complete len:142 (+),score=25.88 GEMP01057525.1:243-668(+)